MAAPLANVTFHNKLGSQALRIFRIAALAREIAPIVGADADQAELAARVAKADLSSEMVYEFPELQGIMGRYYALRADLPAAVADACRDHYSPLGPSDDVPTDPVSVAVALADKLDTLTGFWAIDEKPTGSKDPYALRRAALGIVRLLCVNKLSVSMDALIKRSEFIVNSTRLLGDTVGFRNYWTDESPSFINLVIGAADRYVRAIEPENVSELTAEIKGSDLLGFDDQVVLLYASVLGSDDFKKLEPGNLLSFFHDRLKVFLRDEGVRHDVIDACLAMDGADDITLLVTRARALQAVLDTEDGANLIQGFKRANNILTQAEEKDGVEYSYGPDIKFAETDEEKALFAALDTAEAAIKPAMQDEDFAAAMSAMATLRGPVDAFFEAVQVECGQRYRAS